MIFFLCWFLYHWQILNLYYVISVPFNMYSIIFSSSFSFFNYCLFFPFMKIKHNANYANGNFQRRFCCFMYIHTCAHCYVTKYFHYNVRKWKCRVLLWAPCKHISVVIVCMSVYCEYIYKSSISTLHSLALKGFCSK